ncbi:hypothetical protein SBOR_3398 [Sclerotinia borealis F-4128]|uniref:Uncharacterized protein n=1 Tax=Sclerotinia borealis (strain F-4128) TaxID=1432307 RepID=W9CP15_SCLBF|nr:hypothetical protein SBOR_3398 [Sclerotinia borealis F-4128]
MSSIQKDDLVLNAIPSGNVSQTSRYPHILMPESSKGGDSWELPKPSHTAVDVIVSAINFWKPSALQKLLDLSTPRFFWSATSCCWSDDGFSTLYIERSWQHIRVASDLVGLSYHIHNDGIWQLLAAHMDKGRYTNHCSDESDKEIVKLQQYEKSLAEDISNYFPWNPRESEKYYFLSYIITKEGRRIDSDEFDTTASDITATQEDSEAAKANTEAMVKITSELAEIKQTLRKMLEESGALKKRKRAGYISAAFPTISSANFRGSIKKTDFLNVSLPANTPQDHPYINEFNIEKGSTPVADLTAIDAIATVLCHKNPQCLQKLLDMNVLVKLSVVHVDNIGLHEERGYSSTFKGDGAFGSLGVVWNHGGLAGCKREDQALAMVILSDDEPRWKNIEKWEEQRKEWEEAKRTDDTDRLKYLEVDEHWFD